MLKKVRFGIQPRILIMFLFLSLAPLILGMWMFFNHIGRTFSDYKGKELSDLAEGGVLLIRSHLADLAREVNTLSVNPVVLDAVTKSNAGLKGKTQEFLNKAKEVEKGWANVTLDSPAAQGVTSGELPTYLTNFIEIRKAFADVFILNRAGMVVGATSLPAHYYFGTETRLARAPQEYFARGAYISDVPYEASGKSGIYEIVIPIFDEKKEFQGLVMSHLRVNDVADLIRPVKVGHTFHFTLIRADGTLVPMDGSENAPSKKFSHFAVLESYLKQFRTSAYPDFETDNRLEVVGFSRSRLSETYPELNWYVLTEQNSEEAFSPIQGQKSLAITFCIVVVICVVLICFWFTRELTKPIIELDMHLEKL